MKKHGQLTDNSLTFELRSAFLNEQQSTRCTIHDISVSSESSISEFPGFSNICINVSPFPLFSFKNLPLFGMKNGSISVY